MSHPITRCQCHGTEPCQFCIDRHIASIPEDSTQPVGHAAVARLKAECTRLLEENRELKAKLKMALERIYNAAMMCQVSDPHQMRLAVLRQLNGHQ